MLVVKKKYGSFEGFDGALSAKKCLPYDEVSYTHTGCTLVKRTNHPTLVGVLETTGTRYGFTKTHNSIYLCKPLDERYPPFYIGSKIVDRIRNKLITFSFDHWTDAFPRGIFLSLLGDCGIAEAEKKACLLKASPWVWKALPEIVEPSYERERISAFTIDPVGCKDADDCISFLENGIVISIADVSAYVEVNPWMKYAEHIGTSLYENGTCVKPMFPPLLSEDKFSLVEGKDRLAYSLFITFTPEGIKHEWKETIVNVKAYNYESIYETDTTLLKEYVFRLSGVTTDDSHKWIEVFMLYYNTQAAEKAAILRKQKGRNMERARLFEVLSDTYMYLCYESAKYSLPSSDGITSTFHSQLGVEKYAHASSPIRRYVDIINQFALKGKLLEYSCLERFNAIQKAAKTFERELLFLDLYYGSKHTLEGIVLDGENIFIPCLKKVIPHLNILPPKTAVSIKYYTNPQGGNWKEKILFQVE